MADQQSVLQSFRYQNDMVLAVLAINGATAQNFIFNANCPRNLRVVGMWTVGTSAGTGAVTARLNDGTGNITDAMDVNQVDTTIVRAGTIDDAYHEITRGGTLRITLSATGRISLVAYVLLTPVA